MIKKEDFERIKNDVNGNPRYVLHFLRCAPASLDGLGVSEKYAATVKIMNKIGGRKYHNKSFGGGIVFQSYNLDRLAGHIENLKKEEETKNESI